MPFNEKQYGTEQELQTTVLHEKTIGGDIKMLQTEEREHYENTIGYVIKMVHTQEREHHENTIGGVIEMKET